MNRLRKLQSNQQGRPFSLVLKSTHCPMETNLKLKRVADDKYTFSTAAMYRPLNEKCLATKFWPSFNTYLYLT